MPSTSTSRTVTGLTNGTAYTFRVAAVNHTVGDYSETVTATPASTPATLTVSGGSFDFSMTSPRAFTGTYSVSGTENGKPRYVSDFTTQYGYTAKVFWAGSQWQVRVNNAGIPYVYAYSSVGGDLPPTSGWTDTWGGNPSISYP